MTGSCTVLEEQIKELAAKREEAEELIKDGLQIQIDEITPQITKLKNRFDGDLSDMETRKSQELDNRLKNYLTKEPFWEYVEKAESLRVVEKENFDEVLAK